MFFLSRLIRESMKFLIWAAIIFAVVMYFGFKGFDKWHAYNVKWANEHSSKEDVETKHIKWFLDKL